LTGTANLTLPSTGTLATTTDIANYAGTNKITTVGDIAGSGTWNAGNVTTSGTVTGNAGAFKTLTVGDLKTTSISEIIILPTLDSEPTSPTKGTIYFGKYSLGIDPTNDHLYFYNGAWIQLDH
jgi:hypothetical protein